MIRSFKEEKLKTPSRFTESGQWSVFNRPSARPLKTEVYSPLPISQAHNMSGSESENSDESEEDDGPRHEHNSSILKNLVSRPSDFSTVNKPGHLSLNDVRNGNNEYYLFRFPSGLINPADLVDTTFRVNSRKSKRILLKNKSFDVATYNHCSIADAPTLFLPDSRGHLRQVDLEISGQIIIREAPIAPEEPQFNIDDMRSKPHIPPEIKPRSFFGSPGRTKSNKGRQKKKSPKKEHEKRKRLSLEETEVTPPKKKPKNF